MNARKRLYSLAFVAAVFGLDLVAAPAAEMIEKTKRPAAEAVLAMKSLAQAVIAVPTIGLSR